MPEIQKDYVETQEELQNLTENLQLNQEEIPTKKSKNFNLVKLDSLPSNVGEGFNLALSNLLNTKQIDENSKKALSKDYNTFGKIMKNIFTMDFPEGTIIYNNHTFNNISNMLSTQQFWENILQYVDNKGLFKGKFILSLDGNNIPIKIKVYKNNLGTFNAKVKIQNYNKLPENIKNKIGKFKKILYLYR